MSFNIEQFGSDASNAKSILGGINYYRYYNKNNDTITNVGYFPASLGLELGDRICVIPSIKTNADEWYVVSSISNRKITVSKIESTEGLPTSTTATLAVADWSNNSQTVNVTGVKANNIVFVAPAPASNADYVAASILCTAQAAGTLTFECSEPPINDITVNVVIFG